MKRRSQSGMTLIEVLIAITLVSLLSVAMLFAIRSGISAMDASQRRMASNRRAVSAQRILSQQVAGFLPVKAKCGASVVSEGGGLFPFFQGTPSVMRFVTTYSLDGAGRGFPQVVELFILPGENGAGFRLVVNEIPYTGPAGAGFLCLPPQPDPVTGLSLVRFPDPQPSPRTFILADKLAFCRFLYLQAIEPEPDHWVPVWTKLDFWPRAIRVEMAPLERDASRIPPMTFTGLIRPNRMVHEQYAY
ncbi:MAG: prepilin-type N-terminal cleavage/methylation domain-containing protein [Acidobacteria bacterium]|nr:prepilin-type N-terminal cleavage/methylation domain-containing protein [Acidobacteriota bacterium]